MDIAPLQQVSENQWQLPATGKMRVPVVFYADRALLEGMDENDPRAMAAAAARTSTRNRGIRPR